MAHVQWTLGLWFHFEFPLIIKKERKHKRSHKHGYFLLNLWTESRKTSIAICLPHALPRIGGEDAAFVLCTAAPRICWMQANRSHQIMRWHKTQPKSQHRPRVRIRIVSVPLLKCWSVYVLLSTCLEWKLHLSDAGISRFHNARCVHCLHCQEHIEIFQLMSSYPTRRERRKPIISASTFLVDYYNDLREAVLKL